MLEKSAVRILVLDDESFMLKLLSRILSNLGFTYVTLCDSGRAALERICGNRPNLILLDLNMPEMDGIEFVRHLGRAALCRQPHPDQRRGRAYAANCRETGAGAQNFDTWASA